MFMHTIVFVHKTVNQCKQNFLDIIYTKSQCCIYLTALGDLPQLQLSCITRFTKVFNVIPYPETLCHSKFELKICHGIPIHKNILTYIEMIFFLSHMNHIFLNLHET